MVELRNRAVLGGRLLRRIDRSGHRRLIVVAALALMLLGCGDPDTSTASGDRVLIPTPTPTSTSIPATPVPASTSVPAASTTTGPTLTDRTIRLGVAPGRRPEQTPIDAFIHTEQLADRRFEVLRTYSFWDGEFPDLRHQLIRDNGQMLHLSVNARRIDGSIVEWADIATAIEGDPLHDELVSWVDRIADYEGEIRFTFHHEPDIEPEFGTPEDFVAAWRSFSTVLKETAPDVETVWVLSGFNLNRSIADEFWPGDDYVDVIAADAFNWFGCRGQSEGWRSPARVIAPLMVFGARHPDKKLMLAELGSDEDPRNPERKAEWLAELGELLTFASYEQLDTVVFFHNDHEATGSACDWWIDSGENSAAAFAELAALPVFRGDTADPPPEQCPVVDIAFSQGDDLALVDSNGDGSYDFDFGETNRFIGIGDQSDDGADHQALFRFDSIEDVPDAATLELRIRVGERQPLLTAPIELRLLDGFSTLAEAFNQPGQLVQTVFDASSPGGHHIVDLTGVVDPTQPLAFRLQLASPPEIGDGIVALYVGTGDASREIDRPALIVRHCGE